MLPNTNSGIQVSVSYCFVSFYHTAVLRAIKRDNDDKPTKEFLSTNNVSVVNVYCQRFPTHMEIHSV